MYSMRAGDRLVLNCGKLDIDFRTTFNDPVNFPTDVIFNFTEWRKEENYKKIVRMEEDVDLLGNKKCYYMNDNFEIIIVHDVRDLTVDNDNREEIKQRIPHFNQHFETYFVTRNLSEPPSSEKSSV